MAVGIGARQLGGNFSAIDGPASDAEIMLEDGHIEAREVKHFENIGIAENGLQIGRGIIAGRREMHHMAITVAARHLHHAQAIAMRVKAHGLAVDCDAVAEGEPWR